MNHSILVALAALTTVASGKRLACVGDSVTYGYLSSSPETKSYPSILSGYLGDEWEVVNLGQNGARMQRAEVLGPQNKPWWDLPLYDTLVNSTWDSVIIALGTNDARDVQNLGPPNWPEGACMGEDPFDNCPYAEDYLAMIDVVRGLGNPDIYIVSPPPLMGKAFYLGMNSTVINEVLPMLVPQIAQKAGVKHIDVFTEMGGDQWPEGFPDQSMGAGCKVGQEPEYAKCSLFCDEQSCDQCHPNDAGYAFIADVVFKAIQSSLA